MKNLKRLKFEELFKECVELRAERVLLSHELSEVKAELEKMKREKESA